MERYRAARRDHELVVLEGFHAVKHALRFEASIIEMAARSRVEIDALARQLAPDARAELAQADEVPDTEFATLAPLPHPTGLIAIARRHTVDPATLADSTANAPLVFLERPAHLGNLGAAVRVGAAAGACGLLTTGQHDPWSPEAVRAAAGLQFALPSARIDELPETSRPVVALDPEGEPISSFRVPPRPILAFGPERHGLSDNILQRADHRVAIPMTPGVSSLNLATAVAVTLYAFRDTIRSAPV